MNEEIAIINPVPFRYEKKINKNYTLFAIVLIVMMITALFAYINRDVFFAGTPWQNDFALENPTGAISDTGENTYIINQSMRQIVKADREGNLKYIIDAEDLGQDYYTLFKDLVVDDSGNLYVLGMLLDGVNVVAEEILHFSSQGVLAGKTYRKEYAEDRPIRPGYLRGLNLRDGILNFYAVEEEKVTFEQILLTADNTHEIIKELTISPETYMSEITGMTKGSIYYTTLKAEVFRIDKSGEHILVYPINPRIEGEPFSFPVHIAADREDGGAYVTDIGRSEIVFLDAEGGTNTIICQDDLSDKGFSFSLTSAKSLKTSINGSLSIITGGRVLLLKEDGTLDQVVHRLNYPLNTLIFRGMVWLSALLFFFLLIWALHIFYVKLRERRISLITKQIMAFIPIFIVSMFFVSWVVRQDFNEEYEKELYRKLTFLVHLGSETLDNESVERITSPAHYMNEDFINVHRQNQFILRGNPLLDADGLYSMLYKVDKDDISVLMYSFFRVGTNYPIEANPEMVQVVQEEQILTGKESDADGTWMYARGPIYSDAGEIIAIHEVGLDIRNYEDYKTELFWKTNTIIALIAVLSVVFVIFTIYYLLLSIKKLRQGVTELSEGNLDHSIEIKTGDEIEELAHHYNKMTGDLKEHINKLQETTAEKERIESELQIANRIQTSLLPRMFPPFPDREEFNLYALMEAAKEVGGDFYDFFLIDPKRLCMVVGDVSGKGVPAALFMVITKTLIKNEALQGRSAGEIFNRVNNMLCEDNDECMFVTAFLAILNTETGEVEYCNAGHNPSLLKREGELYEYMKVPTGFVLGGMEDYEYFSGTFKLGVNDELFIYSDGVSEAMDANNNMFGESRLEEALNSVQGSEKDILLKVREKIKDFVQDNPPSDDITMLLLRFRGKGR